MEPSKKLILAEYQSKQKELGKRQREYKKILAAKLKSREDIILEESFQTTNNQLRLEKDDLRARIWVANGTTHIKDSNRYLAEIREHVFCQQFLLDEISKFKIDIHNLEQEIIRGNKQLFELNKKTVPDAQYQKHVQSVRAKLSYLQDQLEVSVRRECEFAALNAKLKEEIINMLHNRTIFNDSYTKLVQKLNSDKKYIIDLIDYALNKFDNCITLYDRIDTLVKRNTKENSTLRADMHSTMRKIAEDAHRSEFIGIKSKFRPLADLQPKEYRRREEFHKQHTKKILLYTKIMDRIQNYTQTHSVEAIIQKFNKQESLYYSYFHYANEMAYHMTILNNSVNRLYSSITKIKWDNNQKLTSQREVIRELERQIKDQRKKNDDLTQVREEFDARIMSLLRGIEWIFKYCNCNPEKLLELLGEHKHVNMINVHRFFKMIEKRVYDITAYVYVTERQNDPFEINEYTVSTIAKACDYPTEIDNIVLAQQCPECAESEAVNVEEVGEHGVTVHSIEETKKKISDVIYQPEIQYRLHSISQCRLPRSRLLASKRDPK
ncbi:uncharacterized protein LOC119662354 [Teleopsis dalmanni]|uniref:uncharacterized protein LOC119662354 n=1 Tax=Teleopsis dalmanni TaxID=139649 RepID=UPI0018CFE9A9|nr:uncharacterized protein LOC119662354 [Teleopsis dalmanni]